MITILALGDSLTTGYGLAPDASFASRLEQALKREGRNVRVIDGGVSGDTVHEGLRRIGPLLNYRPDLVIVEFGANDWYMRLPVEGIKASLARIIDKCRDAGAKVLLAGVSSLAGQGEDYDLRFHNLYQELAGEKNVPLVPDFMPGIPGNLELTLPDGLHPNEVGVAAIMPMVRSMIREIESDV